MIKIITDSTAYIPEEYAKAHDLTIVPLRYLFKGTEYVEGKPGTFAQFFSEFTASKKNFPKTSMPATEIFLEEIEKSLANGDEVLIITLSSTASGAFNSASLAKEECSAPEKVSIVDSLALAQVTFGVVMEAVRLRDEGKSREEIVRGLAGVIENSFVTFVPDSLDYLAAGGRIGKVTATVGSILKVKPIIIYKKGVISNKNTFGLQKAMKDMLAMIPQKIKSLFILHVANTPLYESFKKMVFDMLNLRPDKDKIAVFEGEVGPVIASHTGPAVGVAYITDGVN